jgi:hypothetical protein
MHHSIPQHIARGQAIVVQVSPLYVERKIPHVAMTIKGGLWSPLALLVRGNSAYGAARLTSGKTIYYEAERELRTSVATDDRFGSNPATVARLGDLYIALRWSTTPLRPLSTAAPARRAQRAVARDEDTPSVILIDDRARIDASIDIGPGSALDYPFSIPDRPNQVLFRRYLLRHITWRQGEIYQALRQIAHASIFGPVTLRPGLRDEAGIARADVIRRAVIYMLANDPTLFGLPD